MTEVQAQNSDNAMRTLSLLAGVFLVAASVGWVLGGVLGLALGGLWVAVTAAASLRLPAAWSMRMLGARPLPVSWAPGLHRIVRVLASRAGVPAPALYLAPSRHPNAVAAGGGKTDPGALAVTAPLLRLLPEEELTGVLAHEVAHLRNKDTALLQLAATISRATVLLLQVSVLVGFVSALFGELTLARWSVLLLLSLLVPRLLARLNAALSRAREFAADAAAAELTGDPLALASALMRLDAPARSWLRRLIGVPAAPAELRSHPSTTERVRRLEARAPHALPQTLPYVVHDPMGPHWQLTRGRPALRIWFAV